MGKPRDDREEALDFRSVADLSADIAQWAARLPGDLELIVGVPRSGLLAANLLALHLNLPLTDVGGFVAGRVMTFGPRCPAEDPGTFLAKRRKVLVIDDSLWSGNSMRSVKETTKDVAAFHEVQYGAVYVVSREAGRRVDHFFAILRGQPRVFEWNVMHHEALGASCVDIDGVLCRNPLPEENDDGPRYREFLTNVQSLVRPGRTIGTVVTCRLEKYRSLTEQWMKRNGITYGRLVMFGVPGRQARAEPEARAGFKATAYRESGAVLFIESSLAEAIEIARLSGQSVLSMEGRRLVRPDWVPQQRALMSRAARLAVSNPLELLRRLRNRGKRFFFR
jgi:orotate phosphoribosyltransferase